MKKKLSSIIPLILFCFILMSCGSGGGSIGSGGSDDNNNSNKVTSRVSVNSNGNQTTTGSSSAPSISSDGRYVAFESDATDLVTGDSNGLRDIFVHDRNTGATTRISVDISGTDANNSSSAPSISPDGRYVAFESNATDLVTGDTNGLSDIFVRDRNTGITTRISVDISGTDANGNSFAPSISSDGRYVAFESLATDLVAGDTNGLRDIFVHDRDTDNDGIFDEPGFIATSRVSVNSSGNQATNDSFAPSISSNGMFVVFESTAINLVANDTNGLSDIFVRDRNTGTTTRVSVDSGGNQATSGNSFAPYISSNGMFVAFESTAINLVANDTNGLSDIFVRDRNTGTTTRVSVNSNGNQTTTGSSSAPTISSDGRFVAFESLATDLVTGNTNGLRHIFVHDRDSDNDGVFDEPGFIATSLVSVNSSGNQATNSSSAPFISSDSNFVAFESAASNLVLNDTNGLIDIFVRDR